MKRIILIFSFLTLSSSLFAQSWLWVKASINHNPASLADPFGVATDNSGNVYQTGTFYEGVNFGSFLVNSTGDDSYLAKYDSNGNVIWIETAANIAGNGNDGYAVAIDKANNAFITGYYSDSVAFGTFRLSANTSSGFFIAKYNGLGNIIWAKGGNEASSASSSIGYSVAVDKQGNSYVAGRFTDTVAFGKDTLIANSNSQVFLVKYDTSGNVIWAKCSKGSLWMYGGMGVSTDNSNHILLTGNYGNSITFGSNTLTSNYANDADVFIVKYDSAGNVLWAKGSKESSYNGGCAYAITNDGYSSYVTGQFYDTLTFGAYKLACHNNTGDVFLVKYDSSGNVLWAKSGIVPNTNSSLTHNTGFSVTTGKNGNIYLTGSFDDTITFNAIRLVGKTMDPAFLIEFDSTGTALCGTDLENNNDDYSSVICNPSGSAVYFGGDVENGYKAVFGSDTVVGIDGETGFLAKWQPCSFIEEGENSLTLNNSNIVLYPNPNNGVFQLGIRNGQSGISRRVEIYNVLGEKIYSELFSTLNGKALTSSPNNNVTSNSQLSIDLNDKTSGIYLYRVISENGNLIGEGKFVKL